MLFLITLLASTFSYAAENDTTIALKEFIATYQADWDDSISLSANAIRQLKQLPDNQWQLKFEAESLFASINESSNFNWDNSVISPLHYKYKRSVLGKKRSAEVYFKQSENQAVDTLDNPKWRLETTPETQDKISYQLMLQLDIAAGKSEVEYMVIDKGQLKHYKFILEAEEKVTAPIGTYETIRVKRVRKSDSPRETYIWFAPKLGYQIIKLLQIEKKKKKSYTLLLKTLKYQ